MTDIYTERRAQLPDSYIAFIDHHNGWEGDLGEDLGYVILWKRELIQENYDGYEMARYMSRRWFPIGSNGGGEMLCIDTSSNTDQVFWLPFIGMSDEEALLRYNSFADVVAAIQISERLLDHL